MIKSSDIIKMLKDKTADLNEQQLQVIIDSEMEKPESEMDTELIEYCLDALIELENKEKGGDTNERKTISFKRIIAYISAAIIMLMSAFTVVLVINMNQYSPIEDSTNEQAVVENKLKSRLLENGIDNVNLPKILFSDKIEIVSIICEDENSADIILDINDESIKVSISDISLLGNDTESSSSAVLGCKKSINVASYTVNIVSKNDSCVIVYQNQYHSFTIVVPYEIDEAVEFAKTIV